MVRAVVCEELFRVRLPLRECVAYRKVHLIAAGSHAWTNRGDKVRRADAKPFDCLYRFRRDARDGAAPACVDGSDDAVMAIRDENRHTVGDPNADCLTLMQRNDRV